MKYKQPIDFNIDKKYWYVETDKFTYRSNISLSHVLSAWAQDYLTSVEDDNQFDAIVVGTIG